MLENFSGSIWNAVWVLLPGGCIVFLIAFFTLKKNHYYLFDPEDAEDQRLKDAGDFEPHSRRYQDLAKLAITLSAAAIAFLISILASDRTSAPLFVEHLKVIAPIVVGFFGACIALLIGFMLLQAVWYEQYCHAPDHNTYTRWKYALSNSLGWTGLLSFVLGFVWLAVKLF